MNIPDHDIRYAAASEMSANIVVTAGAGTGKTTLIVDRILHLLFREQDPILIGEIVTLTFMNKAAQEIKLRLRERLHTFQRLDVDSRPHDLQQQRDWELLLRFQKDYYLNKEHLDEVVSQTLSELEKSQIGTIHSFAAHLLRLYPLESCVSPDFQEDDGSKFSRLFETEWRKWLERELGSSGAHHQEWKTLLTMVDLSELHLLARSLTGELNPLHAIQKEWDSGITSVSIRRWLEHLASESSRLEALYPAITMHRMLKAATRLFEIVSQRSEQGSIDQADRDLINRKMPGITKNCSAQDYALAKHLMTVARSLVSMPSQNTSFLLNLLCPFAGRCREKFLQSGYVSFDGLLAKSRDLLRDHADIRHELKRKYKAILVDEFQDTDPVQYEMIMFLGEHESGREQDWRTIQLATGKLFIVGDPKQSIYGFRRADMEAFDMIVQDKILGGTPPGKSYTLQTNFRSHQKILDPLNTFFSTVFPTQPDRGIQPRYEPLMASGRDNSPLSREGIEIRLVKSASPEPDIDEATRAESQELARWVKEEVIDQQEIVEQGMSVAIQPKHIAVLLRTLTSARHYLDAFRLYQIPCMAEGEKHFYKRQEVIDTINLLRSAANPYDQGALVAILRSSLGGLSDITIETLVRENRLTYLESDEPLSTRVPARSIEQVSAVWTLLRDLHSTLSLLPLPEMIQYLFEKVPLRALAAASLDREQALANLAKLEGIVIELARESEHTFAELVAELTKRVHTPPDESERSLSEEQEEECDTSGALRLLSIHKAKGLEFPVVILAGLHRKTTRQDSRTFVSHDWGSSVFGFRAGDIQTINGVFLQAKQQQRERAEQTRILYVGMTRAKRRLILSGGMTKNISSDSYIALLGHHIGFDPAVAQSGVYDYGGTSIPLHVQIERHAKAHTSSPVSHEWKGLEETLSELQTRWSERRNRWATIQEAPRFSNPTALLLKEPPVQSDLFKPASNPSRSKEQSRITGTIAHRLLEAWDFSHSYEHMDKAIVEYCDKYVPEHLQPFQGNIQQDLSQLFRRFFKTNVYEHLQRATIIGREIPFSYLHNPGDSPAMTCKAPFVLEGVIDILYIINDRYWIGDYKTDDIADKDLPERVKTYMTQAEVYREAVRRSLSVEQVHFEFIFLRNGKSIHV